MNPNVWTVCFNHHSYDLPIKKISVSTSIAIVDFIHCVSFMHDVAIEANRYMNHNISNAVDIIVTPECRCVTLATQLALMNGCQLVMLRKSLKAYDHPDTAYCSGPCQSLIALKPSQLYLTQDQAAMMKGKRVLVLDDVASTGRTFIALNKLLCQAGIKADFFAIFDEDSVKDPLFAALPSYYFLRTLPVIL
ncbi:phosphoribosyltransferase family protein [Megasphaera cerevisiae]|jgi:adenine phosphoribosyltransferase|uniref:phosphoribosyltransferase family protein n=1 Tax=Megasphaera cerevisiae TaxID=39029 RepID=UPI00065AECE0|nr:phosphoribosyltransferase family protein [Megasphaera cerevisiae]OKY54701.1 hypothetical protein BSR42_01290 [Megasphaera cerevisiae]SJZ65544.1 adenine phosphoribosyltransferase [Megasphaera cerevisiae DSM 20462]